MILPPKLIDPKQANKQINKPSSPVCVVQMSTSVALITGGRGSVSGQPPPKEKSLQYTCHLPTAPVLASL